jgi:hypothetical protein
MGVFGIFVFLENGDFGWDIGDLDGSWPGSFCSLFEYVKVVLSDFTFIESDICRRKAQDLYKGRGFGYIRARSGDFLGFRKNFNTVYRTRSIALDEQEDHKANSNHGYDAGKRH